MKSYNKSGQKITFTAIFLLLSLLVTQQSIGSDFWKYVDYSDFQSTPEIELVVKTNHSFHGIISLPGFIFSKVFISNETLKKDFYKFSNFEQSSRILVQIKIVNIIYTSFCPAIVTLNKNNIYFYSNLNPYQA